MLMKCWLCSTERDPAMMCVLSVAILTAHFLSVLSYVDVQLGSSALAHILMFALFVVGMLLLNAAL